MALNFRNLALLALALGCLLQVGAQLFAISIMAATIAEAPPRSFAILEGAHGYDSSGFWETVPPITFLLFVVGLAFKWKSRRRGMIAIALGLFIASGLLAGMVVEPQFASLVEGGYRDVVDTALQRRAQSWYALDWAVWSLSLVSGLILLVALTVPAEQRQRIKDSA